MSSPAAGHLSASVSAADAAAGGLSLTPAADLAVRQAHRNLDRIDVRAAFRLSYSTTDS